MVYCYGRFSGTENGWMLFENDNGDIWEEKSSDWEEIIYLTQGFSEYRRKHDGFVASAKQQ